MLQCWHYFTGKYFSPIYFLKAEAFSILYLYPVGRLCLLLLLLLHKCTSCFKCSSSSRSSSSCSSWSKSSYHTYYESCMLAAWMVTSLYQASEQPALLLMLECIPLLLLLPPKSPLRGVPCLTSREDFGPRHTCRTDGRTTECVRATRLRLLLLLRYIAQRVFFAPEKHSLLRTDGRTFTFTFFSTGGSCRSY